MTNSYDLKLFIINKNIQWFIAYNITTQDGNKVMIEQSCNDLFDPWIFIFVKHQRCFWGRSQCMTHLVLNMNSQFMSS